MHISQIHFRQATTEDTTAIVNLVESAYRGERSRQGWTTEADLLDGQRIDPSAIQTALAAAHQSIILATKNNQLLACAQLDQHHPFAYFGMFAVSPTMQGKGLGHQLLQSCERIAQQNWHCTEMRMQVIWMRHELIAFYERRGYCKTGERMPFPYGDARFGLPKRDDLEFIILSKKLENPT